MKKITTLLVSFLLLSSVVKAQYVNIPDSNFAKYLITQIPSCLYKDSSNLYWMDTTCSGVLNMQYINVTHKFVSNLAGIMFFKNLTYLDCENNLLSSLPNLPNSLYSLYCDYNQLTSFPSLPTSLTSLSCSYNHLANLPTLPDSLQELYCNNNLLINLPTFPKTLLYIHCNDNLLTSLPTLPNSLNQLFCYSNPNLFCLPILPKLLNYLVIDNSKIKCLPNINLSLSIVDSVNSNISISVCDSIYNPNNCIHSVNNPYVNIPDVNFRMYLISLMPGCFNSSQQLDTTCSTLTNTYQLDCSNHSIKDLTGIGYFSVLGSLNCNNNQLTTLPSLPQNIGSLSCDNNQLTSLPTLSKYIYGLSCNNNQLINLPKLTRPLDYLSCNNNQLTSLPIFPNSLIWLYCNNNKFNQLSSPLPDSLEILSCLNNPNLHCLPELPNSLYTLLIDTSNIHCLSNHISVLFVADSANAINSIQMPLCTGTSYNPNGCSYYYSNPYVNIPDSNFRKYLITQISGCFNTLQQMDTICKLIPQTYSLYPYNLQIQDLTGIKYFQNIGTLDCSNNLLNSLSNLPNSLGELYCNNNQLNNIDSLPNSLTNFNCSHNQLSIVPILPNPLTQFDCSYNQLTSLPTLPNLFNYLVCNNNQLTSLPYLPNSLTYLDCDSNQITSLPIGHYFDSLSSISCKENINLNCLPQLPSSLMSIDVTGTGIKCIPNLTTKWGNYQFPNVVPNLPICNPTNNANQCQPFPIISGKVFTDDNSNGIKDSNEYYRPFVQLTLNTGESVVTNTNGEYKLNLTDTGTYTLTTRLPNGFKASPASNTFTFNNNNSSLTLPDIALQPLGVYDSLTVFITPWTGPDTKPAAQLQYFVSYENVGYYYNIQDSVKITYDTSKLQFDSSSIPLLSQSGNTILASVDSLFPGIFNYFFLYFSVKTTAASGDSLLANATITSQYSTDTSFCQVNVVSSFDPNSKDATPILSPAQVANGTFIDYTIHFQNTGNDTAYNIVLADTLSPLLQSNILQVVATSHPCNITLNDSIIYFEFLKVNIPDSGHNQFKSNGFVHFRLLPVSTVATGSTIYNKASIYFDYNKPVVTNTASTFITPFALPVIISNYTVTALPAKEGIQVTAVVNNWNTSTEINTDYYNIQRSLDGIYFYTAGKVTAKGAGSYSFTDSLTIHDSRLTILYYRLQIVDKNGKTSYSDTKQITIQPMPVTISIYPNPARNFIVIRGNNVSAINIIDNTGRLVMSKNGLDINAIENKLNVNLSNGIYLVQIVQTDGKIVNEKLIIMN